MNPRSRNRIAVPRLRERLREATADAIAAAAEEVFAEQGLRGAHMGEIARRAGVAVGTLYNHFADREALLAELVARRRSELVARLDEVLAAGADKPFREQLASFLRALFAHFEAHRKFFTIALATEHDRERAAFPASKHPPETMRMVYDRVEELMKRGLRKRALRSRGSELHPSLFMGIVKGVFVRELYAPEPGSPERHVDTLVGFFLDGAGAREP
jgi:AcrR family transcriptional regulator